MDTQELWDQMGQAYKEERWGDLERLGKELGDLLKGNYLPPEITSFGRGFNEALAKAGVEFVMDRFQRRTEST